MMIDVLFGASKGTIHSHYKFIILVHEIDSTCMYILAPKMYILTPRNVHITT